MSDEVEPKKLQLGTDMPSPDVLEEQERIDVLKATVEKYIPDFVIAITAARQEQEPLLILQQDAFAATYVDDEYTLLGMAIKYAGLHGVELRIIGTSGETF